MSNKQIVLGTHPEAQLAKFWEAGSGVYAIVKPSSPFSYAQYMILGRGMTPKRAWANASVHKSIPRAPMNRGTGLASLNRYFAWGSELRPWPGELEYLDGTELRRSFEHGQRGPTGHRGSVTRDASSYVPWG